MFRAQANAFDDAVVKATDENLTSENWEYILVRSLITLVSSERRKTIATAALWIPEARVH
jgi:hypothetical protein